MVILKHFILNIKFIILFYFFSFFYLFIYIISDRVSPQKYLRGGVTIVKSIPKNPSGKILRRELHKLVSKL